VKRCARCSEYKDEAEFMKDLKVIETNALFGPYSPIIFEILQGYTGAFSTTSLN
jgi:hypothetical protein